MKFLKSIIVVLCVTIFLVSQSAALAHVTGNDEDHSHDGVTCTLQILNESAVELDFTDTVLSIRTEIDIVYAHHSAPTAPKFEISPCGQGPPVKALRS